MVRIGILCRNEKATIFVEQSIVYQSASTKILLYYINTCFTVNKLDKSKIIKFKLNNFHALLVTMLYFINVKYVIVDISLSWLVVCHSISWWFCSCSCCCCYWRIINSSSKMMLGMVWMMKLMIM